MLGRTYCSICNSVRAVKPAWRGTDEIRGKLAMQKTYLAVFALLLSVSPAVLAQHTITTVAGGFLPNNVAALSVGIGEPTGVSGDSAGHKRAPALLGLTTEMP
jgi:hypothetical protein